MALPAIAIVGAIAASQIHAGNANPRARAAAFQLQAKQPAGAAGNHTQSPKVQASKPANATKPVRAQAKGSSAGHGRAHASLSRPPARNVEAARFRRFAPRRAGLVCAGASGMVPANYGEIVAFLTAHGYTKMAAAGIAGNMYQESQGNPESVGTGGGGLIGWTPLPAGFVTGNVAADLHTQLEAVLAYNQQWAQYIPALNAATSPTQAADIYMTYFERPGLPAAYNREGAAQAVAQACGMM